MRSRFFLALGIPVITGFAILAVVTANGYRFKAGWGYGRGVDTSREYYAFARYENARENWRLGFHYNLLGLRTSVDSTIDYIVAMPLLKRAERLERTGRLAEARKVCLDAQRILVQDVWDSGLHSNCVYP